MGRPPKIRPTPIRIGRLSSEGLARRLKKKRKEVDLSTHDLAYASGITAAAISKIENGNGKATAIGTVERIARALRVSPQWLAYGHDLTDDEPEGDTATAP